MKSLSEYNLIIFDMDGTLADRDTGALLEGVAEYFQSLGDSHPKFSIATNQGGVGLRYWMEKDDFGEAEKYPTIEIVEAHIHKLVSAIVDTGYNGDRFSFYKCFSYITKKGVLAPTPKYGYLADEWNPNFRKPNPGMLMRAMWDAGVRPLDTLMVGDSPEDEEAAKNATCDFMWADDFFKRNDVSE